MATIDVKIKTAELKPGQVLAEDVYDLHGRPLLYSGVVLTPRIIRGLILRDYLDYVKIRVPCEEAPQGLIKPEESVKGIPRGIHRKIGNFFQRARDVDQLEAGMVEELSQDVKPVIDNIFDSQPAILDSLQLLSSHDDHTHQHSWMVMLLTLSILRNAEIKGVFCPDRHDKLDAALGALLHDIGKSKIPLDVLLKPGKLTDEEFDLIRKHPTFGYQMVKATPNLMPIPKAIIAHHHRYLDGSGYGAEGLQPLERVPDLVRIVTIADVYDAIVSERPYHVAALPYHAMKILYQGADSKFDSKYIDLLQDIVAAFPVGCFLLFHGGIVAQVEKIDQKHKDAPYVRIIASLSRSTTSLVGRSFRLNDDSVDMPGEKDIILGAYSPESLFAKIRGAIGLGKSVEEIVGPSGEQAFRAVPVFDEAMHRIFSFLAEKNPEPESSRS